MQTLVSEQAVSSMPTIRGLHHYAYKCRDAEETRHFYEDILGLPMTHVMEVRDLKSTTGQLVSFVHIFFQMANGGYLAFFDLGDGKAPVKDPATPPFSMHMALGIDGEEALKAAMKRLEAAGIEVQGPLDQEGYVRSIYFWDPNGIRLELTYEIGDGKLAPDQQTHDRKGREILKRWTAEHRARSKA
jgi:catechol 2,3-dioxygenase-like lactoylglutathione lyase family enzyme